MEEIKMLREKLIEELDAIREIEDKTLNDRSRYEEIQEQLRTLYKAMCLLERYEERGDLK